MGGSRDSRTFDELPPFALAVSFVFTVRWMVTQLLCFLAGLAGLVVPGILMARALGLGNNSIERWTYGSCLGLAGATYLASAASHIDLRIFYPLWGLVAMVAIIAWIRSPRPAYTDSIGPLLDAMMLSVLLAVAFTLFGVALPQPLPGGALDPTFHLLLARKIQLAHHAIDDWRPFADVTLNYPTGSHTLLVVLAAFSRLPLEDVFRLLMPALGVLTTAQIYLLARRVLGNATAAVCSSAIYGLWAWYGSLDYFRWGGLPNELAMLMFIAALSLWFDGLPKSRSIFLMAIFIGAMVLVHHHLMIVAGGIVGMLVVRTTFVAVPRRGTTPLTHPAETSGDQGEGTRNLGVGRGWDTALVGAEPSIANLILACLLAGMLILFFLIPYAAKAADFANTGIAHTGEPPLNMVAVPTEVGRALFALSLIGICLWIGRRIRLHYLVGVALFTLALMFVVGEYLVPLAQAARGRPSFTAFTPSRFLTDTNYFLPMVAAAALLYIRQLFKLSWIAVPVIILLATLLDIGKWEGLTEDPLPAGYIEACRWIQKNTSPDTIVDDARSLSERTLPITNWTSYLSWRRTDIPPLPVSEPLGLVKPMAYRIPKIMSGQVPPDSSQMKIVRIVDPRAYTGEQVLWRSPSGLLVVQEWPLANAAATHAK